MYKFIPTLAVGWFFNVEEAKALIKKLEEDNVPHRENASEEMELSSPLDIIEQKLELYFLPVNSRMRKGVSKVEQPEKYHVFFVGEIVINGFEKFGTSPHTLALHLEGLAEKLKAQNADRLKYLGNLNVKALVDMD
nr:hypothetical protein K-LCC10_0172 [Kaumoebavirus]